MDSVPAARPTTGKGVEVLEDDGTVSSLLLCVGEGRVVLVEFKVRFDVHLPQARLASQGIEPVVLP